jgi:hypothetical protein
MIARHRGEHDNRWGRSRPGLTRPPAPPPAVPQPTEARAVALPRAPGPTRQFRRWAIPLTAAVGIVLAAIWLLPQLRAPTAARALPQTPRAWLDAYEAAVIDNPGRVCSALFSPQLAAAYGRAIHATCPSYFRQITSYSVTVRRVFREQQTAVVELHQTVAPRDWAIVLNRRRDGWQAVDLLPGKPLR